MGPDLCECTDSRLGGRYGGVFVSVLFSPPAASIWSPGMVGLWIPPSLPQVGADRDRAASLAAHRKWRGDPWVAVLTSWLFTLPSLQLCLWDRAIRAWIPLGPQPAPSWRNSPRPGLWHPWPDVCVSQQLGCSSPSQSHFPVDVRR